MRVIQCVEDVNGEWVPERAGEKTRRSK